MSKYTMIPKNILVDNSTLKVNEIGQIYVNLDNSTLNLNKNNELQIKNGSVTSDLINLRSYLISNDQLKIIVMNDKKDGVMTGSDGEWRFFNKSFTVPESLDGKKIRVYGNVGYSSNSDSRFNFRLYKNGIVVYETNQTTNRQNFSTDILVDKNDVLTVAQSTNVIAGYETTVKNAWRWEIQGTTDSRDNVIPIQTVDLSNTEGDYTYP